MSYIVWESCIECNARGLFWDCPTDAAIKKAQEEQQENLDKGYGVSVYLREKKNEREFQD